MSSAVARAFAASEPARPLRILFIASAHNSLSQRVLVALSARGHAITVEVVGTPEEIEHAVERHHPELIVCPMLKTIIPDSVWTKHRCLIVHPGPVGDRGPSSLDWAIELGIEDWGVTVLEASGEVDGGDVWASRRFKTRPVGKTRLYRQEVRRAAVEAVIEAVDGQVTPRPNANSHWRPLMRQCDRRIEWSIDPAATVIRRIHAAEGHPGVLDTINGREFHLFGAHPEPVLRGEPGAIIAQRDGAICRATVDGAVWISHLKAPGHFKLPAVMALGRVHAPEAGGYREITYREDDGVGYLHFDFYNGAMSTDQCRRLLAAYRAARERPTRALVLMGGPDFFSNGIHLNVIEADANPAVESWWNLLAMDDLVKEIIETTDKVVVSALVGDAAAGGVPLALAADHVIAREDVVLNPYYRHMGGLYGSEYWTYLLPRRVGPQMTARLTNAPFEPVGADRALEIGLIDVITEDVEGFVARLDPDVTRKRGARERDEARKPLAAYRAVELARSHECFFGPDRSYHEARHRFVYKLRGPRA